MYIGLYYSDITLLWFTFFNSKYYRQSAIVVENFSGSLLVITNNYFLP